MKRPSPPKTNQMNNYLKNGRCRPTLEAPRKRGSGVLLRGFRDFAPRVFQSNRKASVGSLKMLDRSFNLRIYQRNKENAPQEDENRDRKKARLPKGVRLLCRSLLMAAPQSTLSIAVRLQRSEVRTEHVKWGFF